jgi:antitoxin YefM
MICTNKKDLTMDTVTYTQFRQKLAGYLDRIEADCTPLIVTRQNAPSVVVMSLDDFKAYEATFHLLSSKNNADRLNSAIDELRSGGGTEQQLIEE